MFRLGLTLFVNKVRTNAQGQERRNMSRKEGFERGEKGKELEERKVLRILMNHGFKQVPTNMATGYRLGWQRLATGNLMEWSWSWQLVNLLMFSTIHGIFITGNCKGLLCQWRTEKETTKLRLSRMARHLKSLIC